MSLLMDKLRGLSNRFLNTAGVEVSLNDERQVAAPPPIMATQYLLFSRLEKESLKEFSGFSNSHTTITPKAYGTILDVRVERDCKSGLWNMRVSTSGDFDLSDTRIKVSDSSESLPGSYDIKVSNFYNHEIKSFEDRLVALGFEKPLSLESPVFKKCNLSDDEVTHSFAALQTILREDKNVIELLKPSSGHASAWNRNIGSP